MKKLILFLTIAGSSWLLSSCNSTAPNTDQILQNEASRKQLFEQIASNHEMMMAFMPVMMGNEHAKMMLQGNKDLQGMMMSADNMMQMMKDNPSTMHNMMSAMMKDGPMMAHMMQMMSQGGMMSEDCMHSSMMMMQGKGMNMGEMMNH